MIFQYCTFQDKDSYNSYLLYLKTTLLNNKELEKSNKKKEILRKYNTLNVSFFQKFNVLDVGKAEFNNERKIYCLKNICNFLSDYTFKDLDNDLCVFYDNKSEELPKKVQNYLNKKPFWKDKLINKEYCLLWNMYLIDNMFHDNYMVLRKEDKNILLEVLKKSKKELLKIKHPILHPILLKKS